MRLAVVLAVLAAAGSAAAGPRPGGEGQRSWWDVGPGPLVENDFAVGITYSPVCVSLARVEEGPASRAAYAMWREARPGAGSPLPGGAPCSYGVGVRLEGVHWFAPLVAFRAAAEGAWSWDLEEFPAPARTWRFRRYGVDLGVRFGRALGFVRPWADVGLVLGAASHFVERPALLTRGGAGLRSGLSGGGRAARGHAQTAGGRGHGGRRRRRRRSTLRRPVRRAPGPRRPGSGFRQRVLGGGGFRLGGRAGDPVLTRRHGIRWSAS